MKRRILFITLFLMSTLPYVYAAGISGAVYTDAKTLTLVGQAEALDSYHRVDLQRYSRLQDQVKALYACGAGLALAFETNSPYLCVRWRNGAISSERLYVNRILEKGFDLYIKRDNAWEFAGVGRPTSDLETTLVENMDGSRKECLLYLPLYEEITLLQVGVAPGSTLAPIPSPFKGKVLIYGNSITQGAAASRPGMSYPARMSRATGVNFINLGLNGNGFMPREEADMLADFMADAYVLDCVLNCSVAQIQSRTAYMVNAIRARHPDAPIILMAGRIRDRGVFDLKRRQRDLELNIAFEEEYNKLKRAGMANVHYIQSDDFLSRNHHLTTDGSHPVDEGYTLMLSYIQPQLMKIIDKDSAFERQGVIPPEIEACAETIVRQMTLEEKIDYISGCNAFYIRAIPRLGIPEIRMADGPQGIRNDTKSTLFPCGILSAATWNRELVRRLGVGLGQDARARGVHVVLGPGVNIYRSPLSGRNYEYFGEDPYLAGEVAVHYIKGVQSQGVAAAIKHFAGNNQEYNRHHTSSDIDERTLHEIYLPAFKKAIEKANVGFVMNSYNLLNSVHATENPYLNIDVLRRQWGFKGVLVSDWNSVYSGVAAANGGLDLEMPSGKFMNREVLLPAIANGIVTEKSIDEKVRRILQLIFSFGFMDRQQKDPSIPEDNAFSNETALDLAREGVVLLKNENNALPLKKKKILVVGPNADKIPTGGGSGFVRPLRTVSVLEGLRQVAGATHTIDSMREDEYVPISASGEITGAFVSSSDSLVGDFSLCWRGVYRPKKSGIASFYLNGNAFRLYIDDKEELHWSKHTVSYKEASIMVEAGRAYQLRAECYKSAQKNDMELKYRFFDPANSVFRNQLKNADAVIVCVGFNSNNEKENNDRSFALPGFQEQYIDLIARSNPNIIVVVNAGGGIDVSAWEKKVKAILMAWYPGQQGGTAIAEILTGKIAPTGKLPISIEKRWEDNPAFNSYYPISDPKYNTRNSPYLRVQYTEGVFAGYRGYDKAQVAPRYPFGYGLSYSSFAYSDFSLQKTGDVDVQLSFNLKNTGTYDAAEVVQVYVGDVKASVPRPVKELKGFEKVFLKKGETKKVTISLDREAFAFYDVDTQQFIVEPGEFDIRVASSASDDDLKWKQTLTVFGR